MNGARIVPPMIAAMPTADHTMASWPGIPIENSVPIAPPIMSSGASTPPDVPELERRDPNNDLHHDDAATTPIASCPLSIPLIVP